MTEIYTPPLTARLEQMIFSLTHSFKELSAKLSGINIGDHEALTQFIAQTSAKLQQITVFMAQTTMSIGEFSLAIPHLQQLVDGISSDLATLAASISHDPEVDRTEIVSTNHIKLSTLSTINDTTYGTEVALTRNQINLLTEETPCVQGQITLSGGVIDENHPHGNGGVIIASDNYIHTTLRNENHYVNVDHDKVSISDVNGLKIEINGTSGIKIRDFAQTKTCTLNWDA
jgi:hypothetical protein